MEYEHISRTVSNLISKSDKFQSNENSIFTIHVRKLKVHIIISNGYFENVKAIELAVPKLNISVKYKYNNKQSTIHEVIFEVFSLLEQEIAHKIITFGSVDEEIKDSTTNDVLVK